MDAVNLITDGSADNRTGSGGWAAILRTPTTLLELSGWAIGTTSNRMEMTAAIEGLKAIRLPSEVDLISDSSYLLRTLREKWYENWLREKKSKPRPNMDLWAQLIGLAQFHEINCVKVKGHSGDYWNERADRLADEARRTQSEVRVYLPDWIDGLRCDNESPSGRQCKLHAGHSGIHRWTTNVSNGVAIYG